MISDAHLHLHESGQRYPDIDDAELLFSCTAQPSEWEHLAHIDDPRVVKFYGVHPWYADLWNGEVKERLISILEDDPSAGIGEIGMDSVRGASRQAEVFSAQLRMASSMGRPVSVHMVGLEKETSDIIMRDAGGIPVIIHGFSAESYSKRLLDAGCYLSVGSRLLKKSRENVRRILGTIPEERLLIETDAPHFGAGFAGLGNLIQDIADIMGADPGELGRVTTENLRRIHG